ncbi:TRAP transporter small permease [Nocardioides sp. CF8]|uniref:TRAP transporter small permease n=1 Tax=Nocardioides sp. CF8 TaxID=110319 RepID=UPI0004236037|nr:TRAP transporter small permease [Nocardioides sp. CF8]
MRALKYVLTFRWANVLSEIAGHLSAVALVLATLIMTYGVSMRYVFSKPTVWQTEVSIYLLVFVTFVGAAYGLKHHAHVGVDLLVELLPLRSQLVVRILTALLALGVAGAVVWTSYATWWEAVEGGFRTSTALGAPLSVVYAILPVGMLLVIFQYLAFIIEGIEGLLSGEKTAASAALLGQGNAELAAAVEEPGSTTAANIGEAGVEQTHPLHTTTDERRQP